MIYRIRGVSWFHLREFGKAIADYSRYLEFDSTNNEIIGYRGIAYRENKQLLSAYVDLAVSRNSELIDYRQTKKLIDSMFVTGDTIRTVKILRKLTDALPAFTEGWVEYSNRSVQVGSFLSAHVSCNFLRS